MEQYADVVIDLEGNAIQGATVQIFAGAPNAWLQGDFTIPTKLYDSNGTQQDAVVTDARGAFAFQATNGKYVLQVKVRGTIYATIGPHTFYDPADDDERLTAAELGSPTGAAAVGFKRPEPGAVLGDLNRIAKQIPSIENYGAIGDGITDNYDAINRALSAHNALYVPPGTFMTSAGAAGKPPHKITGKALIGQSREVSIIQATGMNEGRTLFVNDVTDVNNPGIWGRGKDFRLEKLFIRGNWNIASGLSAVTENGTTAQVGIKKEQYDPAAQTGLVKAVSAAYAFIKDCYIDNAWEHGVLFYRAGYTDIIANIFARCRGSALWLTAGSASDAVTSTNVQRNQFVANRGGYGGLYTKYTYGCAVTGNRPFEDNIWGATFGEGADTDISGNYFEQNPFGDAQIAPSVWGLSLFNNYWTIPPVLPSGVSARGFFSYDRKSGLRHFPAPGLGETDNRLGPVRYSCDSNSIGVSVPPAATGAGVTFPAVQNPSDDPDTLDDYKERSITLTDTSGASLAFSGSVLMDKVGRNINVYGQLMFPANTSGADIQLSGIPKVGATGGVGTAGDNAGLGASVAIASPGAVYFSIYPAGAFTTRKNSDFSGKVVFFNLIYPAG